MSFEKKSWSLRAKLGAVAVVITSLSIIGGAGVWAWKNRPAFKPDVNKAVESMMAYHDADMNRHEQDELLKVTASIASLETRLVKQNHEFMLEVLKLEGMHHGKQSNALGSQDIHVLAEGNAR